MTHSPARSHVEGRTKTTFALPESDYARLAALSGLYSLSIRSILDQLADKARRNLTADNAPALLPIVGKLLRKSYGISMKSKQRFEELAHSLGATRNEIVHTILIHQCQELAQALQELPHRQQQADAQKLMEMCSRMLEIYEQPEYAEARKELAYAPDFAECDALLCQVEQLYKLEAHLQNFRQRQQDLTAAKQD